MKAQELELISQKKQIESFIRIHKELSATQRKNLRTLAVSISGFKLDGLSVATPNFGSKKKFSAIFKAYNSGVITYEIEF